MTARDYIVKEPQNDGAMLTRTTHATDHAETLAHWRSMSPNERVALTVELSRRMRQIQVESGPRLSPTSS